MSLNDDNNTPVMTLGQIEIDATKFGTAPVPSDLPVLPTRNLVLFPGVTIPISITRDSSLVVAREASERHIPVGVVCQTDPDDDDPGITKGLYKYGVIGDVFKVFELPDGTHTAIIRARNRFRILGKGAGALIPEARLSVRIKLLDDIMPGKDPNYDVTVEQICRMATEIMEKTAGIGKEFSANIAQIKSPDEKVNYIATNAGADAAEKISLLAESNLAKRASKLLAVLLDKMRKVDITHEIMERAGERMKDNQRSAFLQMQLETIKDELYGPGGDTGDEIDELIARADKLHMPANVRETFEKETGKLRRLNPQTPDYSVQYSYLETLLDLPWNKKSKTNSDINAARDVLEHDHYGLDKVKQRILEQIAVLMHSPRAKAPILCLVGPPGVGKTSLGKSIARSMGREYQRVSLGGMHDESEIRGHRRTYIGAMPGRIIKAMKAAGTTNPVLLLDEIDKVGKDYKGDPAAALLEVLDPEQNKSFHDNYIDIDYDLSNVLFIATANTLSTVERPLLDRMEVIELSGYLIEEKIEIARRYLLPRILKDNDLTEDGAFAITDDALVALIERYTAESGVRQLEKQLASLVRKSILASLSGSDFPSEITPADLQPLLGLPPFTKDRYEGNEFPGVVTGLAWTQVGGEILLAEASLSPGKGDRLTITGNLGDVMKESATIAFQWVKAHSDELNIDPQLFETRNLHIHFPEGAIPKDGPSAGITIATAIASAFTRRLVRPRIAMTGEITLRGRVLPVGGVKEKILAAKRAGITDIVLSEDNRRDIEDIPAAYRDGLNFHYVKTVKEVLDFSLL